MSNTIFGPQCQYQHFERALKNTDINGALNVNHPNTNVLRRPFAKDEIRVWLSFALQTPMILEYAQSYAHIPIVANISG